ncbi:alpha/beta hydrolase [Rhodococcus sp. ACPA4]|uniref:alpha/beta hydrolase n=1 Tax=Rhodococcus sp. ACPA4 TaxID=2028571 RepID=UPI0015CA30E1|nr:alpha/beta hydrolase [Rhodococcus sp. ACPA4]
MNPTIDSELEPYANAHPPLAELSVSAYRERVAEGIARAVKPDPGEYIIEDLLLEGPEGAGLTVRVYRAPEAASPEPVVLYFHGGGFICGGIEPEHEFCLSLAKESAATVVSVDYRLAPEHPYPAALDDAYVTLAWVVDQADRLGVDPDRLAVAGSSAGATLAAALCLRVREQGGPSIRFQMLMHPSVDDRLETNSMQIYAGAPSGHGKDTCKFLLTEYLRGTDEAETPALAFPARAKDLSGLPAAYVGVGQFDPLRDEGVAYAVALMSADVATELHSFPGTVHCSYLFPSAEVSRRERRAYAEGLRAALQR